MTDIAIAPGVNNHQPKKVDQEIVKQSAKTAKVNVPVTAGDLAIATIIAEALFGRETGLLYGRQMPANRVKLAVKDPRFVKDGKVIDLYGFLEFILGEEMLQNLNLTREKVDALIGDGKDLDTPLMLDGKSETPTLEVVAQRLVQASIMFKFRRHSKIDFYHFLLADEVGVRWVSKPDLERVKTWQNGSYRASQFMNDAQMYLKKFEELGLRSDEKKEDIALRLYYEYIQAQFFNAVEQNNKDDIEELEEVNFNNPFVAARYQQLLMQFANSVSPIKGSSHPITVSTLPENIGQKIEELQQLDQLPVFLKEKGLSFEEVDLYHPPVWEIYQERFVPVLEGSSREGPQAVINAMQKQTTAINAAQKQTQERKLSIPLKLPEN